MRLSLWGAALLLLACTGAGGADGSSKKWGVYQIYWRYEQFNRELIQTIDQLGATPDYVMFFRDLGENRGFPKAAVELCDSVGALAVISLELTQWGSYRKDFLQRIAEGAFDQWFGQWAIDAKRMGAKFYLRFGYEMNGGWFSWGEKPALFVAAWQRVHQIFEKAGATNCTWVFSPNVLWDQRTFETDYAPYYPGDSYVDMLGLDGYNFGDNHSRYHRWMSFEEIYRHSIEAIKRFNKPLIISEIGCADDPRKAQWIKQFLEKFMQSEQLQGFIYFNYNKQGEGEPDWRLDSDPETLAVFKQFIATKPVMKRKQ